jgi:hypothetical protein
MQIRVDGHHEAKWFSDSKNGGGDGAKEAALRARKTLCDLHGWIFNRYRTAKHPTLDVQCLHVKLQDERLLYCALHHLPYVEQAIWSAKDSQTAYTSYVATSPVEKGQKAKILFHRLIMGAPPDDERTIVDHIDGNGLNNMPENLRWVTPAESMLNRTIRWNSKTGVTGVTRTPRGYEVSWPEGGRERTKRFTFSLYPTPTDCFTAAVACRREKEEILGIITRPKPPEWALALVEKPPDQGPAPKVRHDSSTGVTGVGLGPRGGFVVTWREDGEPRNKLFSRSRYETGDACFAAAVAFRRQKEAAKRNRPVDQDGEEPTPKRARLE